MSKQLFQDLLATLKRSNKERKLKLANKAGYSTVEAYKDYLESMIFSKKVTSKPVAEKVTENLTDMVIAFDTTGSMNSYIIAVKKHVRDLIPKLFKENPELQLSIVAFGDYCDIPKGNKAGTYGKAYQVIQLTNDENALIKFVNDAQSTAGGDSDEFYELVIKKVTEDTSWREGSNKSVLLIGDADPHKPGYRYNDVIYKIDWKQEAKAAADKGIIFDTLSIHGNSFYKELSQMTKGLNLPFKDSQKTADLLEATSLARGGSTTAAAFMTKLASKEVKSDPTMDGVYGMYKSVIKK